MIEATRHPTEPARWICGCGRHYRDASGRRGRCWQCRVQVTGSRKLGRTVERPAAIPAPPPDVEELETLRRFITRGQWGEHRTPAGPPGFWR